MKLARVLCAVALAFVLASTGCKQSPSPADVAKANEAEIRQWMDTWQKDFNAGDVDALMTLYSPDVLAFDIIPPIEYDGKPAYHKDWIEFFAPFQLPLQSEIRDLRITTSGDVAFVTELMSFTGTMKNGQKTTSWIRVTAGLKKVDGKWLDVHDHASIPVDVTTGKAVMDIHP